MGGVAWHPQATLSHSPDAVNLVTGGADLEVNLWSLNRFVPNPKWSLSISNPPPATNLCTPSKAMPTVSAVSPSTPLANTSLARATMVLGASGTPRRGRIRARMWRIGSCCSRRGIRRRFMRCSSRTMVRLSLLGEWTADRARWWN